jgi:hypothetical protein
MNKSPRERCWELLARFDQHQREPRATTAEQRQAIALELIAEALVVIAEALTDPGGGHE